MRILRDLSSPHFFIQRVDRWLQHCMVDATRNVFFLYVTADGYGIA